MVVGNLFVFGLTTSLIGLLIVFLTIMIVSFALISVRAFAKDEKQQEKEASQEKQEVIVNEEDNIDELVAVITAAIASSLNTSTYNLKVKSIRHVGQTSPAWNSVGRKEAIDSRF